MFYYRLKLSYNGATYEGWQKQPHDRATIQGELEKALSSILPRDSDFSTLGSGRTDSGVHALAQIVKVTMKENVPEDGLLKALNGKLAKSIRILECTKCEESFHPILHSTLKEYRYYVHPSKVLSPFLEGMITLWPYPFDFEKACEASALFKGEHDFHNFYTTGSETKSTERQIFEASFHRFEIDPLLPFSFPDESYYLRLVGSGFLKQMVRCIAGAVLCYAKSGCSLEEISKALKSHEKRRIGRVAPADGLYMYRVEHS